MGYCVSMDMNVRIHESNEALVFKIFKDLKKDEKKLAHGGSSNGEKWYSWVDQGFADTKNLIESFDMWRYEVEKQGEWFVFNYFSGEKLGQDDLLWQRMAPAVEDGSYIECTGEDDAHWKWVFKNGKMKELSGEIVYEDEPKTDFEELMDKMDDLDEKDPYKILGLNTKNPSAKEIEQAYKEKIKQYHPDKFSHLGKDFTKLAEKRAKLINQAKKDCLEKCKK